MTSIALVGPDGSGKTTIAKEILCAFPGRMKYIYMGTAIPSSNWALPTSRMIHYFKLRSYRRQLRKAGIKQPETIATHELESRKARRPKFVRRVINLANGLNRMAEEWFRQLVSWGYQLQGYTVLYDRHFLFEHLPQSTSFHGKRKQLGARFHLWYLQYLYPRPDLVIFLNAPPDVMYRRKQEWSLDHLRRHRQGMLEQGQKTQNFVCVDATASLDKVVANVTQCILQLKAGRRTEEPTCDTPRPSPDEEAKGASPRMAQQVDLGK